MVSGPEAVARSARPFSECANDSGHYTYIIVISLTFVKCFLEKSSALPGQMGAKFRQNEEDAEGKKKLAGFVRVSKGYPEEQRPAMREWYTNLITMMGEEGVREKGHLQINKNVIINLTELHNALSSSPKFPFYSAAYFKALPFIVELRNKNGKKDEPELETCFEALYGVLLLRLQKKPISEGTAKAVEAITSFLSMLANYYDKDRKGELKLDE